jgi:hypothetical protein
VEVDEVLDLDSYFKDPTFQNKKPDLRGGWKSRCRDNFYSRAANGSWVQHGNRFHIGAEAKIKHTKFARVFLGQRFYYRGQLAATSPIQFAPLFGGRGARLNHDPSLANQFVGWVSGPWSRVWPRIPTITRTSLKGPDRSCSTNLESAPLSYC